MIASVIFAVIAAARPAGACSLLAARHQLDPAHASDRTAPGAVEVLEVTVRPQLVSSDGCGWNSCESVGTITLELTAGDDATPPERMGYQLAVVDGTPPRGFTGALEVRDTVDGRLVLAFDSGTPAWGFDLEVRAVDLNGNVGPPTVIMLADPRDGCAVSGRGRQPLEALAVAAVILARAGWSRRRARRRPSSRA